MTRAFVIAASLSICATAFAHPTPTQRGQIKAYVDKAAAQQNAARQAQGLPAYQGMKVRVRTVTVAGKTTTTGEIYATNAAFPFDGGKITPVREKSAIYRVQLLPGNKVKMIVKQGWMVDSLIPLQP